MTHPSATPIRDENRYVISYLTLRRSVGFLGIALPLVLLIAFTLLQRNCLAPPSISHYYYTVLGSYFTGTLCAVALFLFAYNGPAPADRRAAFFAAICALGVVLCPTNPCNTCDGICNVVDLSANKLRNACHYTFASLLFLTFAYFSLFLFTRTHPDKSMTQQKKIRNGVYKICGIVIVVSIACISLVNLTAIGNRPEVRNVRLWTFDFEALALFAFGTSWLVKGAMVLKDK